MRVPEAYNRMNQSGSKCQIRHHKSLPGHKGSDQESTCYRCMIRRRCRRNRHRKLRCSHIVRNRIHSRSFHLLHNPIKLFCRFFFKFINKFLDLLLYCSFKLGVFLIIKKFAPVKLAPKLYNEITLKSCRC